MHLTRRRFLSLSGESALGLSLIGLAGCAAKPESASVVHSDAEWRKILTPGQYAVLRQRETEAAFSSPLDREKREGVYDCAGCDLAVFSSKTKFDSGTGWPSFWKPLHNAVLESEDRSQGMDRTEVRCRQCNSHLGHVFGDGPKPTGLRYCMNGLALTFKAA
jgi:peptide-methionine (R)-S-oxide reductase